MGLLLLARENRYHNNYAFVPHLIEVALLLLWTIHLHQGSIFKASTMTQIIPLNTRPIEVLPRPFTPDFIADVDMFQEVDRKCKGLLIQDYMDKLYLQPLTHGIDPFIWIPRDEYGFSTVLKNISKGISDEGAMITTLGSINITHAPKDYDTLLHIDL
jgi:Extracellular tail, of 10TM putative phosphate transporter